MSVVLTRNPRAAESGSREPAPRLIVRRREPPGLDAVWNNVVAFISLAVLVVIVVFLTLRM